jgi:allophanate hydrolase
MTSTVRAIAGDVTSGRRTAEQVAQETLERIEAYNAIQPEAWISRVPAIDVIDAARQVDGRVAAGESLPLAGVPFAVKDNIDVGGIETTAACPAFSYRASSSAHVIDLLRAAGAIVVGKTNLDQFATGLSGTRSPYGIPGCVFNREYISGGSSSGSAVTVAAGLVPLALGSDTAGSGRVPAAINNLIGLKPTRGRWSSRGLVPACRTLDCITSFTRDVADAALVNQVLTDFDPLDPYSRRAPAPTPGPGVSSFRFGVPLPQHLRDLPPEEGALFLAALDRLKMAGGTPVSVDVSQLLEAAQLLYSGPWVAERAAALEPLLQSNPSAIHPVVRAIVQPGRNISAVAAFRGFYALQGFARAAEQLWENIDVLVMPTAPTIYRRSELLAEPVILNANLGRYTNFVNLLDMSAIALPAGFRGNRTGFGMSLIAPAWDDPLLLQLAARYESVNALPAPELDTAARKSGVLLAVVGAHLSGMPLHWQLTSRDARLVSRTRTAPVYRLYAMAQQDPPKPALAHCGSQGSAIEIEVYELSTSAFGSFVAEVPAPLAIGSLTLEDGSIVRGFVAEPRALEGALDITAHGGWRAYLAQRSPANPLSS